MTSILNIDEELAQHFYEEERKKAPKNAQNSVEAFEKYCKNEMTKEKKKPWIWRIFRWKAIPIVKPIECKQINKNTEDKFKNMKEPFLNNNQ
tara:strand:+ start:2429 stop:2704 length:276 start_codon:yes stop_codon:yes gene_type:complete